MAAFGIVAICPSTSISDFHKFGYETERTLNSQIFAIYSDDETTERFAVRSEFRTRRCHRGTSATAVAGTSRSTRPR